MKMSVRWLCVVLVPLAMSCGSKGKDPFEETGIIVHTFVTNTPTSSQSEITGTSGGSWSNRPVIWGFQGAPNATTKFELKRVINGVETTCEMKEADGAPMTGRTIYDWAATSTQYTMVLTAGEATKTFGPYDITVQSADRVVTGGATLNDQSGDQIGTGGAFFQSRTVDIGGGGHTGANFNTTLAQHQPRLLDFAILTAGGVLKAMSPSLIQETHTFDRLKNDCGFQLTTFAAYTGALDPENMPTPTLAEINGLPDPPAGATSIAIAQGTKFVYRTGEGKKGLVHVKTLMTGPVRAGLTYSASQ